MVSRRTKFQYEEPDLIRSDWLADSIRLLSSSCRMTCHTAFLNSLPLARLKALHDLLVVIIVPFLDSVLVGDREACCIA